MTSKEAILELICEAKSLNRDDGRVCFLRKIIEKDLEVLDILKRNIFVADNTIYATPNELEKDDYKKLKEWYENE